MATIILTWRIRFMASTKRALLGKPQQYQQSNRHLAASCLPARKSLQDAASLATSPHTAQLPGLENTLSYRHLLPFHALSFCHQPSQT
jgi:hypothetical protein